MEHGNLEKLFLSSRQLKKVDPGQLKIFFGLYHLVEEHLSFNLHPQEPFLHQPSLQIEFFRKSKENRIFKVQTPPKKVNFAKSDILYQYIY